MEISVLIEGEVNILNFLIIDENPHGIFLGRGSMVSEAYQERCGMVLPRIPSHDHDITYSSKKSSLIERAEE